MDIRTTIRFYLNDRLVELPDVAPDAMLLDWLRIDQALRGSKEGCGEGDCGACTVLVGRLDDGQGLVYEAVNSCIRFVASLDGTHVVTIEHLSDPMGPLHPVQQAMVDFHGSQCGFCTPGIIMALYAHWLSGGGETQGEIKRALQGNLCRCTGYGPIIAAAGSIGLYGARERDGLVLWRDEMAAKLDALRDGTRVVLERDGARTVLPDSADDLAECLLEYAPATIVAGGTDAGLWVTKELRRLSTVVFLDHVADLCEIRVADGMIEIGAGVSYSRAGPELARHYPPLAELWDRIGGQQVRNAGTIGGNIANGSPIGDTPPALIALGASITLRRGDARRTLPLEAFFIDYGRQDRGEGEFLESISLPLPDEADRHAAYKVTKRLDEDITSVLGAFRVRLEDGAVTQAVLAYGGMAGVPKRARAVEAALLGRPWTRETVEQAAGAMGDDFTPLTDFRATAGYRMLVAQNLLVRFWAETAGTGETRVRELVHA